MERGLACHRPAFAHYRFRSLLFYACIRPLSAATFLSSKSRHELIMRPWVMARPVSQHYSSSSMQQPQSKSHHGGTALQLRLHRRCFSPRARAGARVAIVLAPPCCCHRALHCAHVPFGIIQHAGYYYDHDHAFISITIVQPCRARSAKPVVAKLATSLGHAARRLALLPPRLAYCILHMDIASASCIIIIRMLMLMLL